jgi:CheY-like chemotaxis protein
VRLVQSAVEALRIAAERRSLILTVEMADDAAALVLGDPSRLQQVVSNLLANAIKFTPAKGNVAVSLAVGEDTAVIRVKDTGMGIEAAFLPRVFNRFSQENSTSTRAHGGLGLGLAIARHLVELHQGAMLAESAGLGLGATFSVTLPLLKDQRASPAAGLSSLGLAPVDTARLRGFRILVVDDDRATREALLEVLAHTGAEVRLAGSAPEALKTFEAFRPQLLVCDIAMPGEDGYGFIRKVRALGPARSGAIPAIALTALAHDEDRDRAMAAGFQLHMCKPVDVDRLTEAVLKLATPSDAARA